MLLSPGHPFEVVDERYSYISLLSAEPSTDAVAGASVVRAGDDVWKVIGRELHIRYANGAGKAELSRTIRKLLALAE